MKGTVLPQRRSSIDSFAQFSKVLGMMEQSAYEASDFTRSRKTLSKDRAWPEERSEFTMRGESLHIELNS